MISDISGGKVLKKMNEEYKVLLIFRHKIYNR